MAPGGRADERRMLAPLEQADGALGYRIDWVLPNDLGDSLPGHLGLTFLPGKHGRSTRYPGLTYRRALDDDLAALRAAGVGLMVLLVEDDELRRWGDPQIVSRAARHGIRILRHPWPDGGIPTSLDEMRAVLAELRAARAAGHAAVACMGGVGRTGMVAACALAEGGMSTDAAIDLVRRIRHPDAVETAEQRAFVEEYAAALPPAADAPGEGGG